MTPIERAQWIIDRPRRDWRFWAAVSACILGMCVAIAFVTTIADRNDWRARFDAASDEQVCRSRAAVFADTAQAQLLVIQSAGLAALGRGESLDPFADALDVAALNSLRALEARDAALQRCIDDPSYEIGFDVLLPAPPYPQPLPTVQEDP